MKPSERIYQIFSTNRQKKGGNKNSDKLEAVIQYLDEEEVRKDKLALEGIKI